MLVVGDVLGDVAHGAGYVWQPARPGREEINDSRLMINDLGKRRPNDDAWVEAIETA
jgi:hypothetical protein